MSSYRLATRIAAREARRRPLRSLLVMVLVALPVAGMTVATTIIRTETRTPLQQFEDEFGDADVGFFTSVNPEQPVRESDARALIGIGEARELAPEGTAFTILHKRFQPIRTEAATAFAGIYSGDFVSTLDDRYRLVEGRTTRAGGEVAVSTGIAADFDVDVGDVLVLERPTVELDVVGIVEDDRHLRGHALHFADEPPPALRDPAQSQVLVLLDVPGSLDASRVVGLMEKRGTGELPWFNVRPTPELTDALAAQFPHDQQQRDTEVRWSIVAGALVLAAVGIVIAAAFTVGARQQLATLGQLSANGAPERLLRRVLMLQGTVTGAAGSSLGVAIAFVGVRLARSPMERIGDHRMPAFETWPSDVAVIVAVGTVVASLAALIPARSAARIPTLSALAGRRPEGAPSRRTAAAGSATFVGGLVVLAVATVGASNGVDGNVWAAVAIVGGLCVLFGATATTPALVASVAPLAGRTSGVARLAVRNLTRHRTRTGAVVAAVAAAGALAVGGTAVSRTTVAEAEAYSEPPPDLVSVVGFDAEAGQDTAPHPAGVAQIHSLLPQAERLYLGMLRTPVRVNGIAAEGYGFEGAGAVVLDDGAIDAIHLGADARRALEDDGIVIVRVRDDELDGTEVSVVLGDTAPVVAKLEYSRHSLRMGADVYVTRAFAERRGLDVAPGPVLLSLPNELTDIEQFDLAEAESESYIATAGSDTATSWRIDYRVPSDGFSRRVVETLLAGTATILALIVLGIGLALAAADDREESTTLSVVGAGPRVLAASTAAKAWIMASLGFLLAVPIGFLPVKVVRSTQEYAASTPFPWSTVGLLLVCSPVVAAALALAVSSVATRLRPLRMSTAMFE